VPSVRVADGTATLSAATGGGREPRVASPAGAGEVQGTPGTIQGKLFWTAACDVAALPRAAPGLLIPLIAAAAMAFSSAFVVSSSLQLWGFDPSRSPPSVRQKDSRAPAV